MTPSRALVVGAGVGGLAAAIRLAAAGRHVTLVERGDDIGGKLASTEADGFRFETGPSLLTLPQVFDDLLALAGMALADEVDLVRLDPQIRYHFADGTSFSIRDDPAETRGEVIALSRQSGPAWDEWTRRSATVWHTSERTFFAGPMENPRQLLGRMRSPSDLLDIDAATTLYRRAKATFDDPRLRQWACRYATYAGSDPRKVPATLGCITHVEQAYGCWAIRGGLDRLATVLAEAARSLGVEIVTGVEVESIETTSGDRDRAVAGATCAGGLDLPADVVIADVDASHLYGDLLPDGQLAEGVRRAGRSTSGFAMLLGLTGTTDALAHHNVLFSHDHSAEFDDIAAGRPPTDPTIYLCNATVTDPGSAPPGCESWFVLVNVPATDNADDWSTSRSKAYGDRLIASLERRGISVSDRLAHRAEITPLTMARDHRSPGGAIYGTSSNGSRAAFARPGNRGPVRGLYLVGGSSHPGGGLPIVALSGRIVADMVEADRR